MVMTVMKGSRQIRDSPFLPTTNGNDGTTRTGITITWKLDKIGMNFQNDSKPYGKTCRPPPQKKNVAIGQTLIARTAKKTGYITIWSTESLFAHPVENHSSSSRPLRCGTMRRMSTKLQLKNQYHRPLNKPTKLKNFAKQSSNCTAQNKMKKRERAMKKSSPSSRRKTKKNQMLTVKAKQVTMTPVGKLKNTLKEMAQAANKTVLANGKRNSIRLSSVLIGCLKNQRPQR
jgi:hypothetical protein